MQRLPERVHALTVARVIVDQSSAPAASEQRLAIVNPFASRADLARRAASEARQK